jgi:hypothetical protein
MRALVHLNMGTSSGPEHTGCLLGHAGAVRGPAAGIMATIRHFSTQ